MDWHDASEGRLDHCQVCGSKDLQVVMDLGHQPLCDSLLSESQLNEPEIHYPLRMMRCPECTLNQLDYVVPGDVVYHRAYPYRSGVTKELVDYQRELASSTFELLGLDATSLAVDVGSNDGTLLGGFKQRGARVLGIEPTDIAKIANENGIETRQAFFDEALAAEIVAEHGHASVVTATNVFAHMASLGEVTRGMKRLIGDDGCIVIENHYLVDILERLQFDTIYHEHIRTYTLRSLMRLFDHYGLEVIDAKRVARYGGNIRVLVAPKDRRQVGASVAELLSLEEQRGLHTEAPYAAFREKVEALKLEAMEFLHKTTRAGHSIVGNSCPGRCSTLINFYGIDRSLIPYLAEQPASLKKGLYLPGKHIPVVDNSILAREQPDYVILFAWHYADAIIQYLRDRGVRSKLVQLLPELQVHDLG